ncbi:hypothetical protein EJB05_56495, partial [Eragrostis curvula]
MWACRQFANRSRVLLSQLRPIHRVVLAGASRGHASEAIDGDRHVAKHAAASAVRFHGADRTNLLDAMKKKKHMYLVLDDTNNGITVHKLDVDGGGDPSGDALERLPNPPVIRMESPSLGDNPVVAIVGSNIIGVGTGSPDPLSDYELRDGVTVAFDTKTAVLTVLRDLPVDLRDNPVEFAVAAGNWLYMLEGGGSSRNYYYGWSYRGEEFCPGGLHCLKVEDSVDVDDATRSKQDSVGCWYHLRSPSRCLWSDGTSGIPMYAGNITGHALDPEGYAFFLSVNGYCTTNDKRCRGTFSYDGATGDWTRHGDWQLPFGGQAHYDNDLGVWIGLHYNYGSEHTDGYLCSCTVPSLGAEDEPEPKWKLIGNEKLFLEDPERHLQAKLVPMGGGGRFCLVEILTRDRVDVENYEHLGDGDKCVLRLATFRVKSGDDGELVVTERRSAGSYKLSRAAP